MIVEAKPTHPPTARLTVHPSSLFAGEKSHVTANANDTKYRLAMTTHPKS
jgi:hypothetical protein